MIAKGTILPPVFFICTGTNPIIKSLENQSNNELVFNAEFFGRNVMTWYRSSGGSRPQI